MIRRLFFFVFFLNCVLSVKCCRWGNSDVFSCSPGDKLRRSFWWTLLGNSHMIEPPKCIIFTPNAVYKWWKWPCRAGEITLWHLHRECFLKETDCLSSRSWPLHAKDQDQCYSCSTNSWNLFVFWFSTSHQGRWEWQRWWFDDALAWIQDMVVTIVTE